VVSPDGQIEFHVFLVKPAPAEFVRIAYQVFFHGKQLMDTSYLGLDIHDQPLLGVNVGLIGSKTGGGSSYKSLIAEYMQNGSLGRRINVEARAYNGGIAFRYLVLESGQMRDFLMEDEATEFAFVRDGDTSKHISLTHLDGAARFALPFAVEQPGVGWVAITEVPAGKYPRMSLAHSEDKVLATRLPQHWEPPSVAYHGTTPFTTPWRVLAIGTSQEQVMGSGITGELEK